jgi:hypothetical protein
LIHDLNVQQVLEEELQQEVLDSEVVLHHLDHDSEVDHEVDHEEEVDVKSSQVNILIFQNS